MKRKIEYFIPDLYIFAKISPSHYLARYNQVNKVPYKPREIEKKYYTIGEVADMFKIATSNIRFWESEFDILKPKKNKKGNRQYTKEDIENIKLVYHLVKEKGYTLQGAKDIIKADAQKARDKAEAIKSLEKVKDFLIDLKKKLDRQETL